MPGLVSGQVLGSYIIEEALGEGGFATVYRAYQPSLERPVAIKMLHEKSARAPQFIQRFRQEAEATFSLKHQNIVRVFDFVEQDGAFFMVMEYVDGPTLRHVLNDYGCFNAHIGLDATRIHDDQNDLTILKERISQYQALDFGIVGQIARDVLRGLDYAHQKGIIHRDIKPENVLIGSDGIARLADFGIARVQEESEMDRSDRYGTVAYMSPEQISGRKDLDGRSDLYSFGVMLYEMLTGSVPFTASYPEICTMHLRDDPTPPSQLRADISPALEAITLRCLAKEPDQRFPTAATLITELEKNIHLTPLTGFLSKSSRLTDESMVGDAAPLLSMCHQCGYEFNLVGSVTTCPVCSQKIDEQKMRVEKARIVLKAENMIRSLNLPVEASLDVRDYEYRRTLKPQVQKMFNFVLEAWRRQIKHGIVISPASKKEDRPVEAELIKSMFEINELVAMLTSPTFSAFIVNVDSKREKRKLAANLRGMAVILGAVLHSLIGAKLERTELIREEYDICVRLCDEAAALVRESNPELSRAASLGAALARMILDYPQTRGVFSDEEQLSRDLREQPGSEELSGRGQMLLSDYQDSYERAQKRMADLRKKIQNNIERAQQHMESCDGQRREMQNAIDREVANHAQVVRRTDKKYHREAGKLPGQKSIARAVALVGPIILGLSVHLISQSSGPVYSNFTFLGISSNLMPLIVTAGTFSLGYVISKRYGKFSAADILPLIIAIFGTLGMVVYWAGYALDHNNMSYSSFFQLIVGFFYFLFIAGAIYFDLALEVIETIGCLTILLGLVAIVTPFFVEIRAFNYARDESSFLMFMIFARLIFLFIGMQLGLFLERLEDRHDRIMVEKSARMKELNEQHEETLRTLHNKKNGLDRQIKGEVQRELDEANKALLELIQESDRLSRRLLRTLAADELADCQELDRSISRLRQELARF